MRLRYEINRHDEWQVRSEGDASATTDQAIDGKLVAEAHRARNGRTVITRHN